MRDVKLVDIPEIERGNILKDQTYEIATLSKKNNTRDLYKEHFIFFVCCLKM
jgi:hypothetical protein